MSMRDHEARRARGPRVGIGGVAGLALALGSSLAVGPAARGAEGGSGPGGRYCSATATAAFIACQNEVRDDAGIAAAICINRTDAGERRACQEEAREERREGLALCHEQHAARNAVCAALGEGRYDPDFDPADFESDFAAPAHPNPYIPLAVGNHWEFGGSESIVVEVQDETRNVDGVTCIVVRDTVSEDGRLVEDTDDWFALRDNGDVYYCGEEVKDYEFTDGDDPELPELVSIDGSFKAGRDGDQAGVFFFAAPVVGTTYRQEFSLGNAEDVAEVLSTTYAYGTDPALDALVPQALAALLCDGDCVVTGEYTPLEPDAYARKYYAPGIGVFLEVTPESGEVVQLVGCNFDPRCAVLPAP